MRNRFSILSRGIFVVLIVMLFGSIVYAQRRERVLHSFYSDGRDGTYPSGALVIDSAGHLYGTTTGAYNCGTIFEVGRKPSGAWREGVLHSFQSREGCNPRGVVFDASGNLYGVTSLGGKYGCGTVFELTPKPAGGWTGKLLYAFKNDGNDACSALSSLVFDAAGNLYGTSFTGGTAGLGTVFELTPNGDGSWTESVLHSFINDGKDGTSPADSVIVDSAGNLYGTTSGGGTYYQGTVFELTPSGNGIWTEAVLHSFNNLIKEGGSPEGGLVMDSAGTLYGTTEGGGSDDAGTVFELKPNGDGSWTEGVLYSFKFPGNDGDQPWPGLALDAAGNLYGTTLEGGDYDAGTVFGLKPKADGTWEEGILHSFNNISICTNGPDGCRPQASVVLDSAGNVYGTTTQGGTYDGGTVYIITP